jgi:hypothetical protein
LGPALGQILRIFGDKATPAPEKCESEADPTDFTWGANESNPLTHPRPAELPLATHTHDFTIDDDDDYDAPAARCQLTARPDEWPAWFVRAVKQGLAALHDS